MSEEAAQIAREAKQNHQELKEALKTRTPWDRDVEFTRKSLRRHYLRLIFIHPYALESKDAETHLWMQTSYAFITDFKRRIARLDDTLHNPSRQQPQQPQQQQSRQNGGHGVVEYRKLLQRFRQFLSEEEKFWVQLIVRIRRVFAVDDARRALAALGITAEDEDAAAPADDAGPKRNQYQFPAEADTVSPTLSSTTPAQRESKVAMLSKALVCLGDIERYKEQYNEAGGRPRAGHEDGPPAAAAPAKNGRSRRGGAAANQMIPRMRNYDKAQQCYEQARLLLPHDGNPSHQMAILASYQKDVFASLVHYYRSLCVRKPYDTASENLGSVLSKALEQWKTKGAQREKEREKSSTPMVPRLRVEAFKEKLTVLHALWRVPVDEMDAISSNQSQKVVEDLASLTSERVLPFDMITKTIILAQGALWRHRMTRHPSGGNNSKRAALAASAAAIEHRIGTHLLSLYRVLLDIATAQLEENPEDAGQQDLAQRITATFRRMLPALRVASKWIRGHLNYMSAVQNPVSGVEGTTRAREQAKGKEKEKSPIDPSMNLPAIGTVDFWKSYALFSTTLLRRFPREKLPSLTAPLEEDIELAGFLPLKKFIAGELALDHRQRSGSVPGNMNSRKMAREEVHPNEEQLMRIADLLTDAQALAADEESPVVLRKDRFILTTTQDAEIEQIADVYPSHETLRATITDTEDDAMTETSRTDDDPVRDAFREALKSDGGQEEDEDDDEEDEIVWNPRASLSPRQSPMASSLPVSPIRSKPTSPTVPVHNPRATDSLSPRSDYATVDTTPQGPKQLTTAQDLLMGLQHRAPAASAPQSQLLFGSGATNSIWSTALDSSPVKYSGATGISGQPLYHAGQPTLSTNHSQRSSSLSYPSQSSQIYPGSAVPLGTPPIQHTPVANGWHKRTASQSLARPQMLPAQAPRQPYDSFGSSIPPVDPNSPPYSTGMPAAYADPVYTASHVSRHPQYQPGYQDRTLPLHQELGTIRNPVGVYPSVRSVSQMWGSSG